MKSSSGLGLSESGELNGLYRSVEKFFKYQVFLKVCLSDLIEGAAFSLRTKSKEFQATQSGGGHVYTVREHAPFLESNRFDLFLTPDLA